MTTFLQFVAVTVLGLFTAWLLNMWIGLFNNLYLAVAVWVTFLLIYGLIYDRHQARKRRRDTQGWPERD